MLIVSQIKIATIISVYSKDDPTLFSNAIHSILDQKLNSEIISRIYLVIDGPISSDLSDSVLGFSSKIYKIFRLDFCMGLAFALNHLISNLEDEDYIFRMDSDDWSLPNRYEEQLNYFFINPDIDILGTNILECNDRKNWIREISFAKDKEEARKKIYWRVPVAHPSVCLRRRVLNSVYGYPLSGSNEDIALWFVCMKLGFNFDNVNIPLLRFNVNDDFFLRRSRSKAFSELKVYLNGIWLLDKVTWKYVFPIFRFLFRISPIWFIKLGYSLRGKVNLF
jgi:hypothetical protein